MSESDQKTRSTTHYSRRSVEGTPPGMRIEGIYRHIGSPEDYVRKFEGRRGLYRPGDLISLLYSLRTTETVAVGQKIDELDLSDETKAELKSFVDHCLSTVMAFGQSCLVAAGVDRNDQTHISLIHHPIRELYGDVAPDINGTLWEREDLPEPVEVEMGESK